MSCQMETFKLEIQNPRKQNNQFIKNRYRMKHFFLPNKTMRHHVFGNCCDTFQEIFCLDRE